MNCDKGSILLIPLDETSKFRFTQLPLHRPFHETRWQGTNSDDPLSKHTPLPGKNETISDASEISMLLGKSLFLVVGIIIQKLLERKPIVFYLVVIPNQNNMSSLYFVKKHRKATESINQRLKIAAVLKNLSAPLYWDIPHERVYMHFLDENDFPFDFFVAKKVLLIGNGDMRNHEMKVNEYDYLITGKHSAELKSRQQLRNKTATILKKQRLETSDCFSFKHDRATPNAHAFTLNEQTRNRFLSGKHSSDCTSKIRGGFGIRSDDSGGLVKLYPIISDRDESSEPVPLTKSEMHVVTEVPNVFKIKHSFKTIHAAIENFRTMSEESGLSNKEIDVALGAIASRFLEDISWQLVSDSTANADHLFKNILVDIDQVSLQVKKYNLINMVDMNLFLSTMYKNIFNKVLLEDHVLFGKIEVNKEKFTNHNKFKKRGGHTFMESGERKRYIPLIAHGAVGEVFNISVLLHDSTSEAVQSDTVWKSMSFVIAFLETVSPRHTYQKEVSVQMNVGENGLYTHHTVSGPMLPLLTCFHLASVVDGGISIAIETFGGKSRSNFDFPVNHAHSVSEIDADAIFSFFKTSLHTCMPMMVQRLSCDLFPAVASIFGVTKKLKDESNTLIWGIGCTVATEREVKILSSVTSETEICSNSSHVQTDDFSDSYSDSDEGSVNADGDLVELSGESELDNLKRDQLQMYAKMDCLDSYEAPPRELWFRDDLNYERLYTVINPELPPFADKKSCPTEWFEGAMVGQTLQKVDSVSRTRPNENEDDSSDNDDFQTGLDGRTRPSVKKRDYYPNIAVKCKSHVTYPAFGGGQPFEMQSTTIDLKKIKKNANTPEEEDTGFTISSIKNLIKSQCYSVTNRLWAGEYNFDLKSSDEMGRVFLDIVGDSKHSVFNMDSCRFRREKFFHYSEQAFNSIDHNGSPARMELSFQSPSPDKHLETLRSGIFDTLKLCIQSTSSYDVKPLTSVSRFFLSGVLTKLDLLSDMMSKERDNRSPKIYDELPCIRFEVAALLRTWHSGRSKLRTRFIAAPKLSYMACRPILNRMPTLTDKCRSDLLLGPTCNLYEDFISGLRDVDGNEHYRIEIPTFIQKFDELYEHKYICGVYCASCFKTFTNARAIASFDSHSCLRLEKGILSKVTNSQFTLYYLNLKDSLNEGQLKLLDLLSPKETTEKTLKRTRTEKCYNVYLTGYAGTGKSYALIVSILYYLVKYGMYSFAVISPTKVAAGLVGGTTYHSFLSIRVPAQTSQHAVLTENLSMEQIKLDAIKGANDLSVNDKPRSLWMKFGIRIIFVDETGMLSHDQLHYLDWFLKTVRDNFKEPFGGLRIILCGDVLQLPPIVHQKKALYGGLQPERHPVFFFEAPAFCHSGTFLVLFLSQNKRQELCKSSFVRILNAVRDGAHLDAADLHMMNSVWGGEVDMQCALTVLFALHEQFDKEMSDCKQSDLKKTLYEYPDVQKLVSRMEKFFIKGGLPAYYKYRYDSITHELIPGREFAESHLAVEYIKRFKRLKKSAGGDEQILNFIITAEHNEIKAICDEFSTTRLGQVHVFKAVDKVESMDIPIDAMMRSFLRQQTKTEDVLKVYINSCMSFTSNDVDDNVGNNNLCIVGDVSRKVDEMDEIVVKPVLSKAYLVPHPITVVRQKRVFDYRDPKYGTLRISRQQFPLKPADVVTNHSAQGSSLTRAYIVNNHRTGNMNHGALYSALSRATDDTQPFLMFPIDNGDFAAHPVALAFDRFHRTLADCSVGFRLSPVKYNVQVHQQNGVDICRIVPFE